MISFTITTPEYPILTCLVILSFAAIHILGSRIEVARSAPRRVWLSAAGGISIAYVFVHILPELAHHQKAFEKGGPFGLLDGSERHVYFMALLGLVCFYGLELAVRASESRQEAAGGVRQVSTPIFWLQLASYAGYNLIIGYLLLDREEGGLVNLATYAIAMGLHFVVNDQGLREQSHPGYDKIGRWVLAFAAVAGWTIAIFVDLPPVAIAGLFAFLAGGVILNVLKYELPADRQSDFRAFLLGAAGYAAILLVTP
jgi:hypothetical protein